MLFVGRRLLFVVVCCCWLVLGCCGLLLVIVCCVFCVRCSLIYDFVYSVLLNIVCQVCPCVFHGLLFILFGVVCGLMVYVLCCLFCVD